MASLQALIEQEFPPGVAGTYLGRSGPVDLLCSRLTEILQDDSKLIAIFQGVSGIERWDFYPVEDFANLPKLYVYPTSITSEANPTQIASERVSVFIAVRFLLAVEDGALPELAPGINTLLGHIRGHIYANAETICITPTGGTEIIVGRKVQFGAQQLIPRQTEEGNWALTMEMECSWAMRVDILTNRLEDQPDPGDP